MEIDKALVWQDRQQCERCQSCQLSHIQLKSHSNCLARGSDVGVYAVRCHAPSLCTQKQLKVPSEIHKGAGILVRAGASCRQGFRVKGDKLSAAT